MKEQDKTPRNKTKNKMKICNLPNKEFKVIVMKMVTELERKMNLLMRISTNGKYKKGLTRTKEYNKRNFEKYTRGNQ